VSTTSLVFTYADGSNTSALSIFDGSSQSAVCADSAVSDEIVGTMGVSVNGKDAYCKLSVVAGGGLAVTTHDYSCLTVVRLSNKHAPLAE
jgi:hypothetical protein